MTFSIEVFVQLIIALLTGGVLVKLIETVSTHRKRKAEVDNSLVESSGEVISQWKSLHAQVVSDNCDLRDQVRKVQEVARAHECRLERQEMVIRFLISRANGSDAAKAQRLLSGEEDWYGEDVIGDRRRGSRSEAQA